MLPKRSRLSAPQVRAVLAQGKRLRESFISVKYVVNKGLFAVAVVVPKRVLKSAVKRNNLRRRVYRALQSLPLPKYGQAVIMIERLPSAAEEVQSTLQTCLQHI